MATYEFSNAVDLNPLTLPYTPLSLGQVRRYDGTGETIEADFSTGLLNYNVSLTRIGIGNSATSDSLRGTSGSDLFIWDFAVLSLGVSLPGLLTRFGLPDASQQNAIEVFELGNGDDILNLTHLDDPVLIPVLGLVAQDDYDFAATAFGGSGNDILWSGKLNDSLYGGNGDDWVNGGNGDDTVYGGVGLDTLEGGAGNDFLFDAANANLIWGGAGNDLVQIEFSTASLAGQASGTGDGDDRVIIAGNYASTSFSLGDGNDAFTGALSTATAVDRVAGGAGNDVISTWSGNDVLFGEAGSDALWGGAGGDTVMGGDATDFLYGGAGDNDQIFGGTGIDYYYWARGDGLGDQIFDEFRGTGTAGQAVNGLVVFPGFNASNVMPAGDGVFESDRVLSDSGGAEDMVRAYDLDGAGSGTLWRAQILKGTGAGNYVDFDRRDISVIALWNNDATAGTPVITQYVWDGTEYVLAT